jgi:hypothetical protein
MRRQRVRKRAAATGQPMGRHRDAVNRHSASARPFARGAERQVLALAAAAVNCPQPHFGK